MQDAKLQYNGRVSDTGDVYLPASLPRQVGTAFAGCEITVTYERKRKKRSLNQNAFWHGVVVPGICNALNELGEMVTNDQVHEFLKLRFLRVQKFDMETGELLYEYGRSTASLNKVEFSLLIESTVLWALETFSYEIPPPNTLRDTYSFPEYQFEKESREAYLERVKSYTEMIFDVDSLYRYFRQNPDWKNDSEVVAIFAARKREL